MVFNIEESEDIRTAIRSASTGEQQNLIARCTTGIEVEARISLSVNVASGLRRLIAKRMNVRTKVLTIKAAPGTLL